MCDISGMLNGDYFIYCIDVLYMAFEDTKYRPDIGRVVFEGLVDVQPQKPSGPVSLICVSSHSSSLGMNYCLSHTK